MSTLESLISFSYFLLLWDQMIFGFKQSWSKKSSHISFCFNTCGCSRGTWSPWFWTPHSPASIWEPIFWLKLIMWCLRHATVLLMWTDFIFENLAHPNSDLLSETPTFSSCVHDFFRKLLLHMLKLLNLLMLVNKGVWFCCSPWGIKSTDDSCSEISPSGIALVKKLSFLIWSFNIDTADFSDFGFNLFLFLHAFFQWGGPRDIFTYGWTSLCGILNVHWWLWSKHNPHQYHSSTCNFGSVCVVLWLSFSGPVGINLHVSHKSYSHYIWKICYQST